MNSKSKRNPAPSLRISSNVVQQIRQHARSSGKTEVCGVLIGTELDGVTSIEASIAGANAAQGGAHVTFTQDTWEHIYKVKDRDHPDDRIVGWYHSHPGFGVFLSDHDTFIHKNFFSSPRQVAWVYDPLSDEEGCFGWRGERLERLSQFAIVDQRGGELAGETGKPEPRAILPDDESPSRAEVIPDHGSGDFDLSQLGRFVGTLVFYFAIFAMGILMAWYVFPRVVVIPVDPYTGEPLRRPPHSQSQGDPATSSPADKIPDRPSDNPDPSKPGDPKASNGHKQ